MKVWNWILAVCCLGSFQSRAIDPAQVVILVNDADHESIDLGYYYALKRGVPLQNIVHLPLPEDETISWDVYLEHLYNPLMTWLLEAGWLEGFGSNRKDSLGRNVSIVNDHNLEALVVCKGVPLRIENDPERLLAKNSYQEERKIFYTNRASVDSELALLPLPKANIDAYYPNPLFRRTESRNLFDVDPIIVGRLDGPSYDLARSLIDNALKAEKEGIAGRAYIDSDGPHVMGDQWFDSLAKMIEEQGFDLDKHSEKGRFNLVDRFDEPLFYFGWYSGSMDGPFTHYDFKFPPGAIALHIHSNTAATVRSGRKNWIGPLVARGVTATFGNTSEPYLFFTHQPHLVMEGLFKGLTVGEAALYSIPGLSWAGVFIGDPLYLPPLDFKTSPKNEYDILRSANFARMAGDTSAYKAVLSEHERTHHFSTGLWLFDYFQEKGDSSKAYEYLASSKKPSLDEPKRWGVLVKFAEAYLQVDHDQEGISILQKLLDHTDDKRKVRLQLLNRVLKYTHDYELPEQGELWQKQLDAMMPPEDKQSSRKN